jgi:LuxR family maltose regulon positive regulatory protein
VTESTPGSISQERRIIERPRLIRALDECDSRTILLLATAGYGKTTLAQQWIRTVGRSIWLSCTHEHRDVVTFANDVAHLVEPFVNSAPRAVREYVRAQNTPQRSSRRIGSILADHVKSAEVQWIVIDDYHEIIEAPEVEELVNVLRRETDCRLIIASRVRPYWVTARRILYGEIREITRDMLAMTEEESLALLGRRNGFAQLSRQAEGWPAVLGLAASARDVPPTNSVLPSALHNYLAEELFQDAPADLQDHLIRLSLLPTLEPAVITGYLEVDGVQLIQEARDLGFLKGEGTPTLHPLLKEFLLEKLAERPDARAQVHEAVGWCISEQHWGKALELVSRFSCDDLIEPVLRECFKPLARNGQIATLSSFAGQVRLRPTFPPPSVDLVQAEVALRDGQLALAADLASRAQSQLAHDHPLRSRAGAIQGHCGLQRADYAEAERAFAEAQASAQDERDESEALHGVALARIMGEQPNARDAVDQLQTRRYESPTLLIRAATAEIARRRFSEGIAGALPIEEAQHALPQVDDPRVRSSFAYTVAYTLAQRAEYSAANLWLKRLADDIDAFDLEFAKPHAQWVAALVRLGSRRFGETERLLQSLEDGNDTGQHPPQTVNVRLLRARMLLQTGKAADAEQLTVELPDPSNYPSWRAEYIATRALALACLGDDESALKAAAAAERTSRVVEVRVLVAACHSVVGARAGEIESAIQLLTIARELGAWDPVVCALRASAELADLLAQHEDSRRQLRSLYSSSNDLGLARRAGFRTRATRGPGELLTPRELEVLGLIRLGMRNHEIARALFISPSTTKVHIRHVFEKLGVRTRAEAVARYEMFSDAE